MIEESLSSTKLPIDTDQLTTKNTDKFKTFLSSINLPTDTDQLTTKNTGATTEIPSSTN